LPTGSPRSCPDGATDRQRGRCGRRPWSGPTSGPNRAVGPRWACRGHTRDIRARHASEPRNGRVGRRVRLVLGSIAALMRCQRDRPREDHRPATTTSLPCSKTPPATPTGVLRYGKASAGAKCASRNTLPQPRAGTTSTSHLRVVRSRSATLPILPSWGPARP
jgi:hypothetical protein